MASGYSYPEEIFPEGTPPALVSGTRYKAYWKNNKDPNRYELIGTFDSVLPGGYLKFTDVTMADGSHRSSKNDVVHQLYTFMPAPASGSTGGRRRKSRRASKRSRRGTRKHRAHRRR